MVGSSVRITSVMVVASSGTVGDCAGTGAGVVWVASSTSAIPPSQAIENGVVAAVDAAAAAAAAATAPAY